MGVRAYHFSGIVDFCAEQIFVHNARRAIQVGDESVWQWLGSFVTRDFISVASGLAHIAARFVEFSALLLGLVLADLFALLARASSAALVAEDINPQNPA